MTGDLAGYSRLCAEIRERIDLSKAGQEGWHTAEVSLLGPDSEAGRAEAFRWADRMGVPGPNPLEIPLVMGLARCRAGRYEEAVAIVLPVALERSDWHNVSTTWPILALAYHGLGDDVEARKWLEKTRELRDRMTPRFGRDPIAWAGPWHHEWEWIDFELLAREAEATVGTVIPSP